MKTNFNKSGNDKNFSFYLRLFLFRFIRKAFQCGSAILPVCFFSLLLNSDNEAVNENSFYERFKSPNGNFGNTKRENRVPYSVFSLKIKDIYRAFISTDESK